MNANLNPDKSNLSPQELDIERALRPLSFDDFTGQEAILENLKIFVKAANLLFIDEIHRLSPIVEEYLYSAMEDYKIDIMIESGPNARTVQISLNPFTLIGATTRSGLLTAPMRARFGIQSRLQYYTTELLANILQRSAQILGVPISEEAAIELSGRSRGTPRIANALLRRVRDFAQIKGNGKSKGGPVGITTLATAVSENAETLEEVYEPFLIQQGFIIRTPRGREVTDLAYKHLGKVRFKDGQPTLF